MSLAVYVPSRLGEGYFSDLPAPVSGNDQQAVAYNHGTTSYIYKDFEVAGAVAAHVAAPNPHTQYFLASGVSAFGATLIDDADAATARGTLGLGTIATQEETAYLLADGSRAGATGGAQIFTNGVSTTMIDPGSETLSVPGGVITGRSLTLPADTAPLLTVSTEAGGGIFNIGSSVWSATAFFTFNAYQVSPRPYDGNPAYPGNMKYFGPHYLSLTRAMMMMWDSNAGTLEYNYSTPGLDDGDDITWAQMASSSPTGHMWYYNGDRVAALSNGALRLFSSSAAPGFSAVSYSNTASSIWYLDRYRGSESAQLAVADGDVLGVLQFRGWNGSNLVSTSNISVYAAQIFAPGNTGTTMRFATVTNGSASQLERMRISENGNFLIGTTTDSGYKLVVSGGIDALGATASYASFRIRSGTGPTAPNDGDIWNNGNALALRVNGTNAVNTDGGLSIWMQSASQARNVGRLLWQYTDKTDATRVTEGSVTSYYQSTEYKAIRWRGGSGGPLLSFYDVTTPIARQTLALGSSNDDIINALANLGLTKLS